MVAIIVVAYNRPLETRRLLDSIVAANYGDDCVDLILSIDKGDNQDKIEKICKDIEWKCGSYKIIKRKEKMGLRPHVLACGEMTQEYDSVIVLEDDLVVAPGFYIYAKKAMEFYETDARIAQISLYAYGVNEFISRPFYPEKNEFDTFAMKVTQSWGECWTRNMWEMFKKSEFYVKTLCSPRMDLPDNINKWKENSWKKNFSNYLVSENKYVIYPYFSYTTNYTMAGEHCKMDVPDYHVVLQSGLKFEFSFARFEDCVKYDQFFEREELDLKLIGYKSTDVCIDLYGIKKDFDNYKYVISTNNLPYKIERTLSLALKPHEKNILSPEEGKGIYVYSLNSKAQNKPQSDYPVLRYDVGCLQWKRLLRIGLLEFYDVLKKKFTMR